MFVYLVASQLVHSATLLVASIVSRPHNIALVFQLCQKGVSTETMETRLDPPLMWAVKPVQDPCAQGTGTRVNVELFVGVVLSSKCLSWLDRDR